MISEPWNSPKRIRKWLDTMIDTSEVTERQREIFRNVGRRLVERGWWRGNISEALVNLPGGRDLNDLYL